MSTIKHLSFRDGRITGIHITPGKGGIQTQVKVHAPIDAETAEIIGASTHDLDSIESAKLRFRLIGTTANFTGSGNLQKFTCDISDCEAVNFTLKPTGDIGDGNAKAQIVHVVYTVAFNKPSLDLHAFIEAVGAAPLIIKMRGDADAEQQELPLDPIKAAAAAASAARKAAGEPDPADELHARYSLIADLMAQAEAPMPNGVTLPNASKPQLSQVCKRAKEADEAIGAQVEGLVAECLTLREQVKNRKRLQDALDMQ